MLTIKVQISNQTLFLFDNQKLLKKFAISTAKNGPGEVSGSEKTPRGQHIIRAKIGANSPINSVFVNRRPTGEIYTPELRQKFPNRDWILTRILWLSGLEPGINRLGNVDTMRRYVYIHGTPDDVMMGVPGSRGCIRMRNMDLVELFEQVQHGTKILIQE